jgi:ATP-binding cassette subfamily B protein
MSDHATRRRARTTGGASPLKRTIRSTRLYRDWLKLRPMLGQRLLPVGVLGGLSLVGGMIEASILALMANIAAAMVLRGRAVVIDIGPLNLHMALRVALMAALAMTALRTALQLAIAWLPAHIAANVQAELRNELFDAFARASWSVKSLDKEGHFQELMTNQINQAVGAVMNVAAVISAGAMFLALVASAISLSAIAAAVVLASAIALFAAFRPLDRAGRKAARESSQAYIDQAGGISESVRLAEEAEVFGVTSAYRSRMAKLVAAARNASFRANLTLRIVSGVYQSAIYFIIVGGITGIYFAHAGNLASLGAVVLILVRASSYGQQLQGANHAIIQVMPYLDRLFGSIDRYRASAPKPGSSRLPEVQTIEFRRVSFSYRAGQPVLHDITFEVRGGETVGIIGPTGAGKSTLSQLLLRLREPDSGTYLLNGQAVRAFASDDWHQKVAYLSQEPRLFTGSVADNIRFFREIEQADIEKAARLAYIHDEIQKMPAGYATLIGQQADAVSGGQRQRICLARALAGQPRILVLDEATNALDLASEAAVQASLAGLRGSMTVFIIAHRLSLLRICDRVLVIEGGRVSAFGSLDELARTDHFYRRVASLVDAHTPRGCPDALTQTVVSQ